MPWYAVAGSVYVMPCQYVNKDSLSTAAKSRNFVPLCVHRVSCVSSVDLSMSVRGDSACGSHALTLLPLCRSGVSTCDSGDGHPEWVAPICLPRFHAAHAEVFAFVQVIANLPKRHQWI